MGGGGGGGEEWGNGTFCFHFFSFEMPYVLSILNLFKFLVSLSHASAELKKKDYLDNYLDVNSLMF